MYRCIIIEDEPLAQQVIAKHISQTPQLELVQICRNALDAFRVLHREKIDLIFLDIRMPSINGMDFLRSLNNPPKVIITTAYAEYAVQSYELEAVDYLLKPVTYERFEKSIQKLLKNAPPELPSDKDYLFVKTSGKLVKLLHKDILYIESLKDYIKIHTTHGSYVTLITMKAVQELLRKHEFVRIHRSFVVSVARIIAIGRSEVKLDEITLPIGIKFKNSVKKIRVGLVER
jgi:DNA-binding LytR/AlgR family response regulator